MHKRGVTDDRVTAKWPGHSAPRSVVPLALLAIGASAAWGEVIQRDDFNGEKPNAKWGKELWFPYSGRVDTAPDGSRALRVEWRKADYDGKNKTKHAELTTGKFAPDFEQWIGLRIYFDSKTLGRDSQPVILMQYHETPDFKEGEDWRNPPVSLSYQNGEVRYSWKGDTNRVTKKEKGKWLYTQTGSMPLGEVKPDAWNTFVFHHKFDPFGKGSVELWFNDKYFQKQNIQLGYHDERGPYLKFGFYYYAGKSDFPSRVAWFDDVKLGDEKSSYAEVAPPGASSPQLAPSQPAPSQPAPSQPTGTVQNQP